jgi:hypothetical protein
VAGVTAGQTGGQNMRSRYRKILVAAGAALASMAMLASVAHAEKPAPPYEDFAGCPSEAEEPFVASCIKFVFTGGHIGFGNREIPITNPITLRGGSEQETGNFLNNGEGGIIPAQQTVPGGLVGLTGYKWLDEALGSSELLVLHATVEAAGQPGSIIEEAFNVPVKLHLENPFLGSNCYVGSTANPIVLGLTTGTTSPPPPNMPISGQTHGPLKPEAERPKVLVATTPGIYVDNAYSVPAASGCQFNFGPIHRSIDELVNSRYALPSPAGTNTTELDFGFSVTFPKVIYP